MYSVCLLALLQTWRAIIFSRVCLSVCVPLTGTSIPFSVNRCWWNLVTRTLFWSSLAATIMVQIGRRGTVRRIFENFKKFFKNHIIQISKFWSIVFLRLWLLCIVKKLTRFEQFTKLTEEIHFEVCHSGNLPPIVACRGSTGSVAGGVHRQSTTDVQIQKCCVHIIQRFRTGRIWNWGRSELGAQSGRKNQPPCAIYISNCLNVWQIVLMLLYKTTFFYFLLISIILFLWKVKKLQWHNKSI